MIKSFMTLEILIMFLKRVKQPGVLKISFMENAAEKLARISTFILNFFLFFIEDLLVKFI